MIPPELFLANFGTGSKEETEYKPRKSKYSGLTELEVTVMGVPVTVGFGERGLVGMISAHYARCRSERKYANTFNRWVNQRQLAHYQGEVDRAQTPRTERTYAPTVYASELKDCVRAIYYRLTDTPNTNPFDENPHWAISGVTGTLLHRQLELVLGFLALSSQSELSIRGDGWSGRVDHILPKIDGLHPASILDIKQVGEDDFKKGLRAPKMEGYIAQIALYAANLGIDHGTVLLVCRNTGKMVELAFEIPPELPPLAEARARFVRDAAQRKAVPPAEERIDHGGETHVCRLICAYRRTCLQEPL